MRRADRLFQIIQILRRRELTTAAQLARELEVSQRTIYRDVQDLIGSRVPIEGEAGVGYMLAEGYDLPPLMFNQDEIEALALGARMVVCWGDKQLARAAQDILSKVNDVLPAPLKQSLHDTSLYAPNFQSMHLDKEPMAHLREALRIQQKVQMVYTDVKDRHTTRTLRPLCLSFFAPKWLLTAWCELRNDFRNFRLDRIDTLTPLNEYFTDEPGKTLADYLKSVGE